MTATAAKSSRAITILGWVIGLVPVALLAMSAFMKLSRNPQAVDGFKKFGFPDNTLMPIGIAEASCTLLYLIPHTSALGAVLLAAYLGGAVCVHVYAGEPFWIPIAVAVALWVGLLLRQPRLRAVLPFAPR